MNKQQILEQLDAMYITAMNKQNYEEELATIARSKQDATDYCIHKAKATAYTDMKMEINSLINSINK